MSRRKKARRRATTSWTHNRESEPSKRLEESQAVNWVGLIVIPIATFSLGVLITLRVQTANEMRHLERELVKNIVGQSEEWYSQVHALQFESPDSLAHKKYVSNREVLPDFIRNLEALERLNTQNVVTEEANRFLNLVTYLEQAKQDNHLLNARKAREEFLREAEEKWGNSWPPERRRL